MSKVMQFHQIRIVSLVAGCIFAGTAATADDRTTYPPPPYEDAVRPPYTETNTIGRSENVESKLSTEFADFLGGQERADRVVAGLRTGDEIRLWDPHRDGYRDRYRDGYHDRSAPMTAGERTREWSLRRYPIDKHRHITIDPPTGKMGYGNVRLSLKLAQARLAQFGITQPTSRELSAVLVGGKIGGDRIDGILTERASGAGWGQIAQRYDLNVGELTRNGKASTAVPIAQRHPPLQPEPGRENGGPHTTATDHRSPHEGPRTEGGSSRTAAGSLPGTRATSPSRTSRNGRPNEFLPSRDSGTTTAANTGKAHGHGAASGGAKSNGYIQSGSSSGKTTAYRGTTRVTHGKGGSARSNGYIPSGSSSGKTTAYRGTTRVTHGKSGSTRSNGYISAGNARANGGGVVSAYGGTASAGRSGASHSHGHAKGYVPSGSGSASGIVSANNAATRGSTSSANGRGFARGHGKSK